jgi:molybdopterin converting factor subunit 1
MMQTVRVQLFARFRDLFGADLIEVKVNAPATVRELRDALVSRNLGPTALLTRSRIAVNNEFAGETTPVSAADEIALIPPVSGG